MLSRLLPTVSQRGPLPQCSFHPWATRYHCSICRVRRSLTEELALDCCADELFSKTERVAVSAPARSSPRLDSVRICSCRGNFNYLDTR